MPDVSIFALAAFLAVASLAVFALAYGWFDNKRSEYLERGWHDGWNDHADWIDDIGWMQDTKALRRKDFDL
jgi:hypothetical protein